MGALLLALAVVAAPAAAQRVVSLDEAVRTAVEKQPALRKAKSQSSISAARADEVRAQFLPQLSGTAAYARTTANFAPRPGTVPPQFVAGGSSSWAGFNFFNFGATLNQLVWDFGRTQGAWDQARALSRADVAGESVSRLQVVLDARTAFFSARAQRALVKVARETLDNQDRHMQQVQGFVEVGTRPDIDLAQVRTDRANALLQLIQAENGYDTSKAQLNVAMGVEGGTNYEVADETLPPVDGEGAAGSVLVDEALRARPELAKMGEQLRAQDGAVAAAQGGYFPSISATSSFTDVGPSVSELGWNLSGQVGLTWPLFQGLLVPAQVREMQAGRGALEADRDTLRLQVGLEVDQARLAVRADKAGLDASHEALVNARERLRLAEGRYETGVGNIIELGDAQVALTNAAAQVVRAEFQLATARAQLVDALGRP